MSNNLRYMILYIYTHIHIYVCITYIYVVTIKWDIMKPLKPCYGGITLKDF